VLTVSDPLNSAVMSAAAAPCNPKKRESTAPTPRPVTRWSTADRATTSGAVHRTCWALSARTWVARLSSRTRRTPCPGRLRDHH